MKNNLVIYITFFLFSYHVNSETSWKGIVSSSWTNALNWTSGVPISTVDVIIGDSNFTGRYQPIAADTASACKSLTIGAGSRASILTISGKINVSGKIVIGSNGTILQNTDSYMLTEEPIDEIKATAQ